jgi:hypothetical protein
VHPKLKSNYEIEFVTLIASISAGIIKIFSQCDVIVTPIEIFMLITGSIQILLFLKNIEIVLRYIEIILRYIGNKCCKCCECCKLNNDYNGEDGKTNKQKLFGFLKKFLKIDENENNTCVNRIDIAIFTVILIFNIFILIAFVWSFTIFKKAIYDQDDYNAKEAHCRCDYYGFKKFDEGKFGHSTVYILNTLSLFLSSVSFALLYAREILII